MDPELNIISICHSKDANRKLVAAGTNKIINPYQISGRKIYEIIRKPEVVELLDDVVFGQQDLHIVEIYIEQGCRLDQTYMNTFNFGNEFNLQVLGVEDKALDNDIHFTSSGINHKLDAGDKLIVIGPKQQIDNFQKKYAMQNRN
jgi:voltage-gated potassium channel